MPGGRRGGKASACSTERVTAERTGWEKAWTYSRVKEHAPSPSFEGLYLEV